MVEEFSARFFGDAARLSVQRLSSGRTLRYWEFGPSDGRPVLAMHGYFFPILVIRAEKELERHGIRLFFPLRSGFLDDDTHNQSLQNRTLLDETIEDLLEFTALNWEQPLP